VLLSDSERAKREKTSFWATQKGQKEKKHASERLRKGKWRKKHASEWLRKSKKRKNTLLSNSERANGGKTCFWVTQKEQMEKKQVS